MNRKNVFSQYHTLIQKIRKDIPLLNQTINGKKIIYLDSAATTQKPTVVIKKEKDFYEQYNANVHRGLYTIAAKATQEYESSRDTIAKFLNAEREEIIFSSGTTASINTVAHVLEPSIKENDEIIITIMEHHSNFVPWQQLAQRTKAKLIIVPLAKDNITLNLNYLKESLSSKTKIIAVSYISNTLGTKNPIKEIIQEAKKVGAITIIDAAQAVSHLPIDVKELDCDFLAFSGHKIMGPTGIGILFGKKHHLQNLEPVFHGGEMIKEVTQTKTTWNDLPWKWEAGTPNIAGAIALAEAIRYHQSFPSEKINSYLNELKKYTQEQLKKFSQLTIISSTQEQSAPIITFTLKNIHPHDIAEILNRDNICIRAGHHCTMPLHHDLKLNATARISLYHYNTKEEIDQLIKSLQKAIEVFK